MNIQFLDKLMSAAFSLRKIISLKCEQKNDKVYLMRPQLHIMLIGHFGTGKSSISKMLELKYPKDVFLIDDFTKSSMFGSISKSEEHVPSQLVHAAGKMMIVDEWNSVSSWGQEGILGILENQTINRALGFKVRRPFRIRKKYIKYSIVENIIQGKVVFSCIAYCMVKPRIYDQRGRFDVVKTSALLSRFSPLYIHPEMSGLKMQDIREGDFDVNVEDHSGIVEHVVIEKECYLAVSGMYEQYVRTNNLYPKDPSEWGYVNRIFSDVVRYGIHTALKETNDVKTLTITSTKPFTHNFSYISTLFNQFFLRDAKGRYEQYKDLVTVGGETDAEIVSKKLGISIGQAYKYIRKHDEEKKGLRETTLRL